MVSRHIRAIVPILCLVGATVACQAAGTVSVPSSTPPPAASTATPRPIASATRTLRPTVTPTTNPCVTWDQVTAEMKGEIVCVRGLITKFTQSRQVGTRYQFTDKANTFFMYSNFWEISNAETGKTVGQGTCVEVTGEIELQGSIPFIHIDDLITGEGDTIGEFLIYDDPAACG